MESYYEYIGLPARSIRLLRIQQSRGGNFRGKNLSTELHASIETISLDDRIPFDALSYTWGPPTVEDKLAWEAQIFTTVECCYPIIVDGGIALVTRSLRNALRVMREFQDPKMVELFVQAKATAEVRQRYIWADAICINQADLGERGEQVSLMGEIYSQANTVFAYVGELDENARLAMRAAHRLSNHYHDLERAGQLNYQHLLSDEKLAILSDKEWCEWVKFMCREWFSRTWVIQEAMLGKRVLLACGAFGIRLNGVIDALGVLIAGKWGPRIRERVEPDPSFALYREKAAWLVHQSHPFFWVMSFSGQNRRSEWRPSLFAASYFMFKYTQCANPLDKIYGGIGVVEEFQNIDQSLLPIDYTTSTESLYIRATHYVLWKSRSLDILSTAGSHIKAEGLPSWTPDYSRTIMEYAPLLQYPAIPEKELWMASKSSSHLASDKEFSSPRLQLRGCRCDTITGKSSISGIPMEAETICAAMHLLKDAIAVDKLRAKYIADAFWRSLVLDDYSRESAGGEHPATLDTQDDLRLLWTSYVTAQIWEENLDASIERALDTLIALLTDLLALDERLARFLPDLQHLIHERSLRGTVVGDKAKFSEASDTKGLMMRLVERNGFSDDVERFMQRIEIAFMPLYNKLDNKMTKRCVMRTESGTIGLGPDNIDADDELWLLAGGRVPYALRPGIDGCYEFLGEAYVHGIMHGEAWPEDISTLVDVVLR